MTFDDEVKDLPQKCRELLEDRSGGWLLCEILPELYPADQVYAGNTRAWEVCGLFLKNAGRVHEAIAVFERLYMTMLDHEIQTGNHVMKGMPLVWISDCHSSLGRQLVARRFIMLTLVEDAVASEGTIFPQNHGSYFRAAWIYGLPHDLIMRYAKEAYDLYLKDRAAGAYPEWIVQQLDQEWVTGYPSPAEVDIYAVNRKYLAFLLSRLGDGSGKQLEFLAEYLMSVMPGCRVYRRKRSHSTDYDVVCAMEGPQADFRAEFGRYFVCEAKDWAKAAGFAEFAKFCRVLDSVKAKFGILFAKSGISGRGSGDDATREQMKVFQDRGIIILVVDESDLQAVADGRNFISLLRSRYESVRLDLEA
jgi:hypothetical protein